MQYLSLTSFKLVVEVVAADIQERDGAKQLKSKDELRTLPLSRD
jgi:hypothetical protein